MARIKSQINSIYISERVQECLRHIQENDVTIIVASMGYGKTTAVDWYLKKRAEAGNVVMRINVYAENKELFWRSFRRAFKNTAAGKEIENMKFPDSASAIGFLSEIMMDSISDDGNEYYLFIDDYHNMDDESVTDVLFSLAYAIPNFHLIIASRDTFLLRSEEFAMGRHLYKIGVSDLKLNHTEIAAYGHRCGLKLTDEEIDELSVLSEGWFAAVYLNLKAKSEGRGFLKDSEDIYKLLEATLLDPLSQREREFLVMMCPAYEFTEEMAETITSFADCHEIIDGLVNSNAFVSLMPDGRTLRMHYLLKECLMEELGEKPADTVKELYCRYGQWHRDKGEYIRAMSFYRTVNCRKEVLDVVAEDAGTQLSYVSPDLAVEWLSDSTDEELKENPVALMVLTRKMFSWQRIDEMKRLNDLILEISEDENFSENERKNYIGESQLIMSLLEYNDLAEMRKRQKTAFEMMNRQAVSIKNSGPWTFGSPSILMMFHRKAGCMEEELDDFRETSKYYAVLAGHGKTCSEMILEAEVMYNKGRLADAHIALEKAKNDADDTDSYVRLCANFLSMRLTPFGGFRYDGTWYEKMYQKLRLLLDPILIATLDICHAYFCALSGMTDKIPEWISEGKLDEANLLHPARPMFEIIYNQVLLAKGSFAQIIGRYQGIKEKCDYYPYELCLLHLYIQTAGAYLSLDKPQEAMNMLEQAMEMAFPDNCLMPFVENHKYIEKLFPDFDEKYSSFIAEITRLSETFDRINSEIAGGDTRVPAGDVLTDTEYRICTMIRDHRTNREIAEELYLSEGTVKQYVNQIYGKLGIEGNRRDKRKRVVSLLFGEK